MAKVTQGERESDAVGRWLRKVKDAEEAFLSEWTWANLKVMDGDLYAALMGQRQDFDQACVTGEIDEVEEQGAATLRGFDACARELRNAYEDERGAAGGDGFVVVSRPVEQGAYPAGVDVLTVDDLKQILELPSAQELLAVMRAFPGARLSGQRAIK